MKNLSPEMHEFEYLLENKFFADVDGTDIQKGKVEVYVTVNRISVAFEIDFRIKGMVVVPCDRCLDEMEIPIDTKSHMVVKFGENYAEESDEVIVIPEEEGSVNLAWFMYEFIALAVPMRHVHASGQCNTMMAKVLAEHTVEEANNGGNVDNDPRWDILKGLMKNDNN